MMSMAAHPAIFPPPTREYKPQSTRIGKAKKRRYVEAYASHADLIKPSEPYVELIATVGTAYCDDQQRLSKTILVTFYLP